jgi:hypothetical protein
MTASRSMACVGASPVVVVGAVAVAITAASASPCVRARVRVQIIDANALQLWRLFERPAVPELAALHRGGCQVSCAAVRTTAEVQRGR